MQEQPPSFSEPDAPAAPAAPLNKAQPTWTYFLSPAALVLGSLIISATIWWTRSDSTDKQAADEVPVIGAVSTVEATPPASGAPMGLKDTLYSYAKQVGLDQAKFDQCVNDQQSLSIINQGLQAGTGLGVTGTPTFFINNKKLVGAQPIAILNEIIKAELNGSPSSIDGYSEAVRRLAATNPPSFSIVDTKPDITGAPIEGNANAKVMVAEFSDFQCPFCKQWTESSLRQLRAELGNDVALAFLHFPILQIHPNAGNAAVISVCAQQQGKFWEMHDLLFAKQDEWAKLK
ncbi:MAG: thioredoxin domain-containing protein [Dehalococcoidia bacterium]|nr:thioredoxin domain-containing protein [Dehalococcoidia bacterium]